MYQKILLRITIIATLGLTVALGSTRVLRSDVAASPAAQVITTPSMSIFYKFDVIAETNEPTLNLKTIGRGVSINDKGNVAFVGEYNGPKNLDSQKGKNKVLTSHAQTL